MKYWVVKNKENEEHKKENLNNKITLSDSLDKNVEIMKSLFKDVDINIERKFENNYDPSVKFCIFFSDGVTDSKSINEFIIKPLMTANIATESDLMNDVTNRFLQVSEIEESDDIDKIVESVTYGDTILFIDKCSKAIIINSKSFALRAVNEPEGEKILTGPREGFIESIMTNLSLIRRKLRTHELKIKFYPVGRHSHTQICICYLDNIVNKNILNELYNRLSKIDIDACLDSNYITEYISESSILGFASTSYTERPDVTAAKLLEGRIAILTDGSPCVITIPYLMRENFQSSEDYYTNSIYASFSRILRVLGFLFTIMIPALYIAIESHHHEILPTDVLVNLAYERHNVPLPAAFEAFLMLLMFDILKETSVRMPSHIGQAFSIVGALVIGQAAVQAKFISAPMVIIIAFVGITNLLVPKMNAPTFIAKYGLLFLAAGFGLTGVALGVTVLAIHMINLKSFGIPQIIPVDNLDAQDIKDTFIRAPWPRMLTRNTFLTNNKTRAKRRRL